MSDILFIKTSSLGDVIHHMPAVAEARRRRGGAHMSWVVEEAFAPLVRLHPAVDEVIPIATRRWRSAAFAPRTWQEIAGFVAGLRKHDYDAIVDSQGLFFKSALIARLARGQRHGYDARSIRERAACSLYDVRHRVDRALHAIARNRMLTGLALGYAPEGAIDFGLEREDARKPRGLVRRSAARHRAGAQAVAGSIMDRARPGVGRTPRRRAGPLMVPWGTPDERLRSGRIAAAIAGAIVPDRQPLEILARQIAGASFVIGVDTGLLHLAAALGVPLVGIFAGSEPGLTGPMGQGPIAIVGGKGAIPSVAEVMSALDRLV